MNPEDLHSRYGLLEDSQAAAAAANGDGVEPDEGPEEPEEPEQPAGPKTVNDLVYEVLGAAGMLTRDQIALVQAIGHRSSPAQAILASGLAPQVVADQHGLPFVDLQLEGIDPKAASMLPRSVLAQACAIPYAIEGNRLKVAVADPTNVQAVDELRLATRYPIELAVAARDEIEVELRRISRANEAWELSLIHI